MNDYQMTKLSHGHFTELRAEAHMSHLAKLASQKPESAPRARRGLRARISLLIAWAPEWGKWGSAEWDAALHRRSPRGF